MKKVNDANEKGKKVAQVEEENKDEGKEEFISNVSCNDLKYHCMKH